MGYGEGLGVTLSPRDCWGSLSYQKLCPGFWKHGGSSDREPKGRVASRSGRGPRAEVERWCAGIVGAQCGRTVAETLFSPLFSLLTDRQTKGKAARALLLPPPEEGVLSGGELSGFFLCLQHLSLENVATAGSGFALPAAGGCDSCHLGLVAVRHYQDGGCGG